MLTVDPPQRLIAKRNELVGAAIRLRLRHGYHVNSNTPSDEYLIPLRLSWEAAPLEMADILYPKAFLEKYEFSEKPVSVFHGEFDIVTRFKVPPAAPLGPRMVAGKLRYQACTEKMCLPPKTLDVHLSVDIR